VKRLRLPELNAEFLDQIGVESPEKLRTEIKELLEKQVTYEQRQSARKQVMEQITESANWDLPESLVKRQVENALRREILEMQQAGFTDQDIRARENELLQQQISMTRQALKEHFVLDKIATQEKLEVTPADIDTEISYMAFQRGESPRKVRARIEKQDLMENLIAQILERKAIDVVLDRAVYEDVPAEQAVQDQVEALSYSVCGEELVTKVQSLAEQFEAQAKKHDHDHDHSAPGHTHDHG
jgi:trigger factor